MDEARLKDDFTAELIAVEKSGGILPLHFRPSEAWYLMAALQLVLRHPALPESMRGFLDSLARNIEGRLCKGRPAMTEVARMGWNSEYDQAAEVRRYGGNPAVSPPTEPPPAVAAEAEPPPEPEPAKAEAEPPEPEAAKRKPERTPQNKMLEPPENKNARTTSTRKRKG